MSADNTPISVPRLTPPDGTITSQSPNDMGLDAFDTDQVRAMLNAETTINNRLSDKAKENLAAALESGRYILFFGRLDQMDRRLHWHLTQEDFITEDAERAVFE